MEGEEDLFEQVAQQEHGGYPHKDGNDLEPGGVPVLKGGPADILHQSIGEGNDEHAPQQLPQTHRQPKGEGALEHGLQQAKDQPDGRKHGGGEADDAQTVDRLLSGAAAGQLRQDLVAEGLVVLPDDLRRGLAPGLPLLEHVQNVPVDQLLLVGGRADCPPRETARHSFE